MDFLHQCLDLSSRKNVKLLKRIAWGFSLAFLLFSVRSRFHFLKCSNEISQFGAGVPLFQASRDSTTRRQIQMVESRACIQSFPKETESTKSEEKGHLPVEMSWKQCFVFFFMKLSLNLNRQSISHLTPSAVTLVLPRSKLYSFGIPKFFSSSMDSSLTPLLDEMSKITRLWCHCVGRQRERSMVIITNGRNVTQA